MVPQPTSGHNDADTSALPSVERDGRRVRRSRRTAGRARYRAILEHFDGYVYSLSSDYRLEYVSRRLSGRIPDSLPSGPCFRLLYDFEAPCPWCSMERVLAGKTTRRRVSNPIDNRYYQQTSMPIAEDGKHVTSMQVVMTPAVGAGSGTRPARERIPPEIDAATRRFGQIIGQSAPMQEVYSLIREAAASDAGIMIHGESGTGKELVAHAIHRCSERRGQEFVPVNCGAIPDTLAESEFFGYKKGAFTGATADKSGFLDIADGGTLFLDEVGEIDLSMQVKLLRAIEDGGYRALGGRGTRHPDVRIIAATHRDLAGLVARGRMRADFYYRLNVIPVRLPPLRHRTGDIPLLVYHFMEENNWLDRSSEITPRIMTRLQKYHWPGNVRELLNVLHRFVTLGKIDLPGQRSEQQGPALPSMPAAPLPGNGSTDLNSAVRLYEKQLITRLLDENGWNRTRVAAICGIERKTLYLKMKKLDIRPGKGR